MEDHGHQTLIQHLYNIYNDAQNFEFHNFKNKKYATPKVELYKQLNQIMTNIKNGAYDND
jgi:hypothetical protein